VGGAHFQLDASRRVLQIVSGPVIERPGLLQSSPGEKPVENIPGKLRPGIPAGHVSAQVAAELRTARTVTGENLGAWEVTCPGNLNVLLPDLFGLSQSAQLWPLVQGPGNCQGQLDFVRPGVELSGELKRNVLPHVLRHVVTELVGQVVLCDAVVIPRANQPGPCIGQFDFGPEHIEAWHGASLTPADHCWSPGLIAIAAPFVPGNPTKNLSMAASSLIW